MSSSIYARIEIRDEDATKLKALGLDVEDYAEDIQPYEDKGAAWCSYPMEDGWRFIQELEKLGYPVPLTGFSETESLHTSYVFVCPGDGTYHEIQCDEFGGPVVPVVFERGRVHHTEAGAGVALDYFLALEKFKEATKNGI